MANTKISKGTVVADPPLALFLFSDTRMALVWLLVRIYVGWSFLEAGWHKVQDTTAAGNYIIDGAGILAFWKRIAAIPAAPAKPTITYDWYRGFIQWLIDVHAEVFMGKLIAFGETAVGLGLIFGAFTGIAAVSGAFMNLNFMLAGSASTNPVLLLMGFLLVLAWKTAGYIGLDRFLMPILGTPWRAPRAPTTRAVPPSRMPQVS
jgi:thiosulfate dehydrogenase [quinone] large subunit